MLKGLLKIYLYEKNSFRPGHVTLAHGDADNL